MSDAITWRKALEAAADLLMDHGVIRTGPELEQVCEQIRKLVAPTGSRWTRVYVTEFALMAQANPRDFVIGLLRDKGIPARPGPPWASPTDFSDSVRVDRGLLKHQFDVASGVHMFAYGKEATF
jgi:hypothetical protein